MYLPCEISIKIEIYEKPKDRNFVTGFSYFSSRTGMEGVAIAQSVARDAPGEEVPGSIPSVATRSLLVGSVSV